MDGNEKWANKSRDNLSSTTGTEACNMKAETRIERRSGDHLPRHGVLMGQDNWKLGSILGLSMTVSLSIGTIAGVSIPLLMRRLGFDPAQSSAIFLIMITDAIGLLSFLGFAAFGLKWLQGVGA